MNQQMQDTGFTQATFTKDLARLNALIAKIDIAMLTTRDEDGSLRSRPMGTQSKGEFRGTLYFFADIDSAKMSAVEEHRQVNVAYANPGDQQYVSLSGTARLTQDPSQLQSHWNASLKLWFPKGLDDPKLALLCVDVAKAEFWDGDSKPATLLAMAKALIRGTTPQLGEDKKLDLQQGTSIKV